MSILGGPLPEVEEENKEPNYIQVIEEAFPTTTNLTGRALHAQKLRNKRIAEGKTGLKISEVPRAAYKAIDDFIPEPTDVQSIAESVADLRKVQKGISLGAVTGSIVGEYLPLPKGTGSVLGGAVGYGISRGKRYLTNMLEEVFDKRVSKEVVEMAGTGGQMNDSIVPNVLQATGSEGISSAHMKSKVKLHERALDDEMLHWDHKAVERRSKIDEQFQLDKSGKPEGPHKIRGGSTETERRVKAAWSLGEEVSPADIKVFEESNQSILDGYNWHLHGSNIKVGKTEGHHKGVVRQIFDASNGLNQKYRLKSAKYMEKRIGFELGYHGRNVEPVPIRFHPRVHAIINSRISSSPDRFNVEGIAQRLGFPKNWQSVLTYEERLPLYNAVSDAIRESVDAINTSWKVLLSRSDDLTTYSKEEYLDLMLQHKKLDDKLRQMSSPSFMAQSSKTGWDIKDTSTTVLNEILDKSNRSDLRLPYIGKVEPSMAPEIKKVINQENGWQLLKEVLLTNQSAGTVMKAYPKVKLTVKQQNSLDTYARTLRSRGKSHKFIDELGMRPDD